MFYNIYVHIYMICQFFSSLAASGPTRLGIFYLFKFYTLTTQHRQLNQLGDFNYPNIDWQTLYSHNQYSSAFCGLLIDCNLWQLIDSPTHSAGNILDLVLTSYQQWCCYPQSIYVLNASFEFNLRSLYSQIWCSLHFHHSI